LRAQPLSRLPPHLVLCLALATTAGADGCSFRHRRADDAADQSASAGRLYSPTGERLNGGPLGRPTCADAMTAWFERADTDRDGMLDREEFLADARRQFAVMDLDKDGIVTPAELAQYRAPYEAEPVQRAPPATEPVPPAEQSSGGKRRHGGEPGRADTGGSAEERPDPVMAADVGFRNQVSLRDFMAYAARQFAALDLDHHGRLAKADILRSCHAPEGS
jgi:hypothetical protein